jgi:threonine dehydrogenase-like Zn-dependent dehydrogenase
VHRLTTFDAAPPHVVDMRALTIIPRQPDSMRLMEVPEPVRGPSRLLVDMIAVGICGTDREMLAGRYGWPPPGRERLVIGHESLGRVVEAPQASGFGRGDHVVGIVRRPDPVPCAYCAAGEWDMCRNGRYTERGIKELDGYASDRVVLEPEFAVKVDSALGDAAVLVEPASVVAKAWDHATSIGNRSRAWNARSVLVTGAGPVGLMAALLGTQRHLDVHVYDRITGGIKPGLVRDLGAVYHAGDIDVLGDLAPDIIIECTGATPVIADAVARTGPSGIVCLAGLSSGGHAIRMDVRSMNRDMVLENDVVFGSVNANRAHYEAAVDALQRADRSWLSRLVTRRVPLDEWTRAFDRAPDDVKVVLKLGESE